MESSTCEQCGGAGSFPLVNPWEMRRRYMAKEKATDVPLLVNAPCAECRNEEFVAYVQSMIERHGQPFTDGEIKQVTYYYNDEGEKFGVMEPEGDSDDEDD